MTWSAMCGIIFAGHSVLPAFSCAVFNLIKIVTRQMGHTRGLGTARDSQGMVCNPGFGISIHMSYQLFFLTHTDTEYTDTDI